MSAANEKANVRDKFMPLFTLKNRCENNQKMKNQMFVKPYIASLTARRRATTRTGIWFSILPPP
ncbi:MAG: hypothetical protein LBS94_04140 [Prevotellaceae bacterium]|jgi:hypothetical protein|nr:hypothetical protein [Prevotellaceae bacterium]